MTRRFERAAAGRQPRVDRGVVLLLIPLLWGATFPAAKVALQDMHPLAFMAWTRLLGLATVAVALAGAARRRTAEARSWTEVVWPGTVLGGLIFVAYVLQTVGLDRTTATNAGFITGLYVVVVPLLGLLLFRHRAGRASWAAVALSVVGLALLSSATLGSFRPHLGDILVLAAAVTWAGHVVALARYAPRYPTRQLALAQMAAAALFHVLAAVGVGLQPARALSVAPLLVLTGVLGSGVAYTLQIVAQREIGPARAAVILSGESIASAGISMAWLGERLALHQWIGAGGIIAAMVLSETGARREEGRRVRGSGTPPGPGEGAVVEGRV